MLPRSVAPLTERTRHIPSRARRTRGRSDTVQARARSPAEINLPITGFVLSTWPEQAAADSGVYAALCHTRRHLYGPVASSKSPTFDYLSIWAHRAEGEDKQEPRACDRELQNCDMLGESGNGCSCVCHICSAPNAHSCLLLG